MLPAARRAKTLVVAQGLTRQAIRCPYFSKVQPLPWPRIFLRPWFGRERLP